MTIPANDTGPVEGNDNAPLPAGKVFVVARVTFTMACQGAHPIDGPRDLRPSLPRLTPWEEAIEHHEITRRLVAATKGATVQ